MNVKRILFAFSSLCLIAIANAQQKQISPAKNIIERHIVRFSEPPTHIPAAHAVDAPLLGNGYTGIAVAGSPEQQTFYAARNDFWRLKSALDESYPLILGKIIVDIPSLKDASYLVTQNLYTAITSAQFKNKDIGVNYKTFIAATEDLLVIELESTGTQTIQGTILLQLPSNTELPSPESPERKFPEATQLDKTNDGIYYLSRGYLDSVDIPTKAAIALKVENQNSNKFVLQPGKKIRILCTFSSNFKSKDCVSATIEHIRKSTPQHIATVKQQHEKWWQNYWDKSYVNIPDSIIEKQYYLSLYGMAACSRDVDFPPSIFGTWITKERPEWNGDYHLNYNHMAPFYAHYSANRIEQATPYYMPLLAMTKRGNYYSQKITGNPEGVLLPVGIGPIGIETTRILPHKREHFKGWIDGGYTYDEGFFLGQKSNASYGVVNLSMQFYRTWDKDFARQVYPFVKGVASFWEQYLKYENSRYVIYDDAIHEGSFGSVNSVLSLALVRLVMQTATDMSQLLGLDSDKKNTWTKIQTQLSQYPTQVRNGKKVFRYTEKGADWWDGNTLGIQGIYPAGQIGLRSDTTLLQTAYNTVAEMQRWQDPNGSNSFFPAAARIGYNPDTIINQLRIYSQRTYPNGFQKDNPHGIENFSTVPNTINEMLCMSNQDLLRVFEIWPRKMDASFKDIRAEGAFLVSSRLKNGVVDFVKINSEKGRICNLKNPWTAHDVLVKSNKRKAFVAKGDVIKLSTKIGEELYLTKIDYPLIINHSGSNGSIQ